MYRFALRPRWLLSHLFAVAVVVVFVLLGLWQLRRHDERADRNARVAARSEQVPAALAGLLAGVDDVDGVVEALRYRSVAAGGRYRPDVVVVDNRSGDGLPGVWVLGILDVDDVGPVVVVRGFQATSTGPVSPPAPPPGTVQVTGTVAAFDTRACGVRTGDAGELVGMACLRRDAIESALAGPVAPVVVRRGASVPAESPGLTPVPLPEAGPGPHRGYAGQWFIFATIVAVTYPLILRRVARDRARPAVPASSGVGAGS